MPPIRSLTLVAAILTSSAVAADCTVVAQLEAGAVPAEASCSAYLAETGRSATSCHWEFPFRDTAAVDLAASLWNDLIACRPGKALGPDAKVNHPDSYDLRVWITDAGNYALSVKDKGQLNRTLVFLRFEPD